LITRNVLISINKPGSHAEELTLALNAELDKAEHDVSVNITSSVSTRLVSPDGIELSISSPSAKGFGHSFRWGPKSMVRPDGSKVWSLDDQLQVQQSSTSVSLSLKCDAQTAICPQDGDRIEATIVTSLQGATAPPPSSVKIVAEVRALPSCQWTSAVLVPDPGEFWDDAQQLMVAAKLFDADRLPVRYSLPELSILWKLETSATEHHVLYQPQTPLKRDSYVAPITQEQRAYEGKYWLTVQLNNAWDSATQATGSCIILHRSVAIRCRNGVSDATKRCATTDMLVETGPPVTAAVVCTLLSICIMLAALRCWYLRSDLTAMRRLSNSRTAAYSRLKKRWSSRASLGSLNRRNSVDDLPIHYAAFCCAPEKMLEAVIHGCPEAVSIPDAYGNLPIHLFIKSLDKHHPDESVCSAVELLLAAYPKGVICLDENSKLPIQLLLESSYSSWPRGRLEVLLAFPFHVDAADNWLCLLQHEAQCSVDRSVQAIIEEAKNSGRATIEQLVYAKDTQGREAWAVATAAKRRPLWGQLLLVGRYLSF
jgi:hypothetical protein